MHLKLTSMAQRKPLIILACLIAGSAVFILLRLGSSSRTETASAADGESGDSSQVLPYGKVLDFSLLKKYNPEGKLFGYPVVSPGEVGVPLENLIRN